MKSFKSKSYILLTAALLAGSCKKFDDVNTDQFSATGEQVQIEYFINSSIIEAQMNPDVAERSFVLYWKTAGHQHSNTTFALANYDDGWTSAYYNQVAGWLNSANTAITIAADKKAAGLERPYDNNLVQVARIWRAYLMSEMSDNFGPIPVNGFQGKNPDFSDVKTVYAYILAELKDANAKLNLSVTNVAGLERQDPAYGYNYTKWKKFGNSLRMRFAMRLSEVDATTAKTEFEAAAASLNDIITKTDETFQVQELDGWSPLTGVMSRPWNTQPISATLNNLYSGLGSIKSQDQLGAEFQSKIKSADWMGQRYENHFTTLTNDPSAGYWFDGLPFTIDPRAYKTFIIPGDITNPNFTNSGTAATTTKRNLIDDAGGVVKEIDAKYTWNARTAGNWGTKGARNQVLTYEGTMPRLSNQFRTSRSKRVFFAPWETYFLLAEAAERGWTTPMNGKAAYEAGVASSFEYWGLNQYLGTYLASQDYNRVGTSVSWDHITEPPATYTKRYQNGYTGAEGVVTLSYPKNELYKNGTVKNDRLTKIITQKFIAQTPWLPLEAWNDQRRLGLPFFENPAIETPAQTLPALTPANYMTSSVKFFPQRLRYPSSLQNSNKNGYNQAVGFLNGADGTLTPLYWAKKQ
ncbi:SusD/RagB family nutrient-binding outer membrane lipoprotein [Mucilaginibacter aquatilis]|uniref:SusD/RagB family nutrient-binding outer membrane lipoprotein n=1 Tax=Mucilaginibacter aquatilis TaxID=1517760 RepID=A0A6I4IA10_9SPHI|nr:SusD/RagB family nutrient-binding outer membrane lipoprotein [Mucilaginibacter aquatilis]MVN91827.1 SusD/RagB family nutrient-binding outer membrane lipoprotein [Mucilaginibacter aquatilis]